jgi:hypothetical protein
MGRSIVEIAAVSGFDQSTIRRWLKRPAFQREVDAVRSQLIGDVLGKLIGHATMATERMAALTGSANEPVALGACRGVIQTMLNARAQVELQRKLEDAMREWEALKAERPELFTNNDQGAKSNRSQN